MSTQTSALSQTTTRSSFQSLDPVPTYTSNGFILSADKKQAQLEQKEEKKGKDYEAALAELSGTIGFAGLPVIPDVSPSPPKYAISAAITTTAAPAQPKFRSFFTSNRSKSTKPAPRPKPQVQRACQAQPMEPFYPVIYESPSGLAHYWSPSFSPISPKPKTSAVKANNDKVRPARDSCVRSHAELAVDLVRGT